MAASRIVAAVLLVFLCTGCTLLSRLSERAEPGELRFEQVSVGGTAYTEGSFSYVRVERVNGFVVAFRELRPGDPADFVLSIPAGRYRLVSYQRPCDGSCAALDPPTARCRRIFEVEPGERVRALVRVRAGSGCTATVTSRA